MLKDRDIRQRTLGFISFSFLAHLGLIAATFLIPNMIKEMKPSSSQSETYLIDSQTPASLGESAQAEPQMVAPVEPPAQVMTAPVDDSSAIVVAKNELPQKVETKPVAKKVATPAREKAETATKKVLALPSKKAAPAKAPQKVQTVDQSELEVNQALKNAREDESSPEVAADIEVPEVNEEAQPQQEESQVAAAAVTTEEPSEKTETVESATTSSTEEEATEVVPAVVTTLPAAKAAPVAQPAPAVPAPQPMIAPIQRGAQVSNPAAGQVGGLGTAGAPAAQAAASGGIRDADSLMEQPGNIKPQYADDDQRNGRQGVVVFDAIVTREGTVQGIQLKQSSGFSSLDSSAYEAFKKHRYLPGQEGSVRKKFQFVLNGEKTLPSRLRRR